MGVLWLYHDLISSEKNCVAWDSISHHSSSGSEEWEGTRFDTSFQSSLHNDNNQSVWNLRETTFFCRLTSLNENIEKEALRRLSGRQQYKREILIDKTLACLSVVCHRDGVFEARCRRLWTACQIPIPVLAASNVRRRSALHLMHRWATYAKESETLLTARTLIPLITRIFGIRMLKKEGQAKNNHLPNCRTGDQSRLKSFKVSHPLLHSITICMWHQHLFIGKTQQSDWYSFSKIPKQSLECNSRLPISICISNVVLLSLYSSLSMVITWDAVYSKGTWLSHTLLCMQSLLVK